MTFGASDATSPFQSFDNAAGLTGAITLLSSTGVNGAFVAASDAAEIGSPGTIANSTPVPEVPYLVLIPATALAVFGGFVYLKRRRRGRRRRLTRALAPRRSPVMSSLQRSRRWPVLLAVVAAAPVMLALPPAPAGAATGVIVSEVTPWASGNTSYAADWFELTNTGASAVDITGWKVDDNSHSPAQALALTGVSSIGAGQSVVFIEGSASTAAVVPQRLVRREPATRLHDRDLQRLGHRPEHRR